MEKDQIVDCLYLELSSHCTHDETLGELEKRVEQQTLEIRRELLQRLTQDAATHAEFGCTGCGRMLNVLAHRRPRTVVTTLGEISLERSYGCCKHCQTSQYPADIALGLQVHAKASPRVQEICALSVLRAPAGKAEKDVQRLSGVAIGASTLHREARRQGERALALRERDVQLSERPEGVIALAARAPKLPSHSTVVIEIDAWNIRERDHWGDTQARRNAGQDVGRWHWVYTATVFRLDQRASTQSGRQIITERGYVATRAGLTSFKQQLYAEALQRGLLQAETVLVIADGAVWIWNLTEEQFRHAKQRVDLFHVKQHLWALAAELHGSGTEEAKAWVRPYLRWLDNRKNAALDLIESLDQLQQQLSEFNQTKQQAVLRELNYFEQHKQRMDYKAAKTIGEPCGSGAIESTCSQYQRRFKLTGQFWSLAGDEAFLALDTLHRNERWHLLFPHDEV